MIKAIFGGVDLDLRGAIIDRDCKIDVTNIFGGTDIQLPPNVRLILNDTPILGGTVSEFCQQHKPFCAQGDHHKHLYFRRHGH
ncbi:MAG: hypothetical protein QM689_03465 [Oscillospiraceae bacterium]